MAYFLHPVIHKVSRYRMLKQLLNNTVLKQINKIPVFKPFQEHEITAASVSLKEGWLYYKMYKGI